jgi:hypothetical protein
VLEASSARTSSTGELDWKQRLVVAGDSGVLVLRPDGEVAEVLSRTPASHPRLSADLRRVYFLARSGELREVSVQDRKERERVVARLPGTFKLCKSAPDYPQGQVFRLEELRVHDNADFVIDQGGSAACLTLADRNLNMRNVAISFHVELASGRVRHQMVTPECGGEVLPSCKPLPQRNRSRTGAPPAFACDVDTGGNLVQRDANGATRVLATIGQGDFGADEPSPSGRWAPLRGNIQQGDYIHTDLFLLDRRDCRVWPIRDQSKSPLDNTELSRIGQDQIETLGVVGESVIRWLPEHDRLLVDRRLVTPGVGAIELPGDVAPW